MQSHTFEAPTRSRLPWVFIAILLVGGIAAAWLWLRAPAGPQAVAEGELLSASASTDGPARSASSGATSADQAPNRETAPAAQPAPGSGGMMPSARGEEAFSTEALLAQADDAFDTGELFVALPIYKEVAVRLQVQLNQTDDPAVRQQIERQLADITKLVRDSEEGIRALKPAPDFSNRTPHPAPAAGEVRELNILELGNFPYDDEAGGVPADVMALQGATVRITGYMLPAYQTDQIKTFTLVNDVYQCCFGQPPGVEHTINIILPEGKAVPFSYGEIQVTGTLRVEEQRRDGYVVNLFTIDDVTSVRATGRP